MKKETLIALMLAIADDRPEPKKGKRGRAGRDFNFNDHEDEIKTIISKAVDEIKSDIKLNFDDLNAHDKDELSLKWDDLTDEQKLYLKGPPGRPGKDGKFDFEQYRLEIEEIIKSSIDYDSLKIKFDELTDSQKLEIKGEPGRPGKDGKFNFEQHKSEIEKIIKASIDYDSLRIKFEDLTESQKNEIRGKDGKHGRDGRDGKFVWDEHKDAIAEIVANSIDYDSLKLRFEDLSNEQKNELTLKFKDLTDDQIELLKGRDGKKGKDGKDGKSIIWDDVKSEIYSNLKELFNNEKESFKLRWDDLSGYEKDSLKLKFSELTDQDKKELSLKFEDLTKEQKEELRGTRGRKGQIGRQGASAYQVWKNAGNNGNELDFLKSLKGRDGLNGIDGIDGKMGPVGRAGKDGQDAPYITDIEAVRANQVLKFRFHFSDGSSIETNWFDFPEVKKIIKSAVAISSGQFLQIYKDSELIGNPSKINIIGEDVDVEVDQTDPTQINIDIKPRCLRVQQDLVQKADCAHTLNFQDPLIVVPDQVIAKWPTLSEVDSMATYLGDPNHVTVYLDQGPDISSEKPVYDSSGFLTSLVTYRSLTQTMENRIQESNFTYNAQMQLTQEVTTVYKDDGITSKEITTLTYTYSNNILSRVDRVVA